MIMFPLFEKSLKSNLEALDISMIWRQIFKILRILMNVESDHIIRIYRSKYLIEILKYCLRNGAQNEILTKDLVNEILNIVKDVKVNKRCEILLPFYRSYFHEIVLNYDFCVQKCLDVKKKKHTLVISEVVEFLYSILQED